MTDYEKIVSAKIAPANVTDIPKVTDEVLATAETISDTIIKVGSQILENKVNISNATRVSFQNGGTIGNIISDILISRTEEGDLQAILTAVPTAGISTIAYTITAAGVGAALGVSSSAIIPIIAACAISGYIGYHAGKWLDDRYEENDFKEEFDIFWDNKFGKAIIDTSISNPADIRSLVAPLYNSAVDCDLNEIEVRVKPENEGDEPVIYTIKPGDTIWDICNKLGMSYEELIELNPWLKDRFSDDMKFALIRPGEKLKIPKGLAIGKPGFDVPFDIADGAGTPGVDPILVDLDGDEVISTTSVEDGRYFDHQKDGFGEKSAWVSGNDGMLVIDKNNDGVINDGGEVFGDNYVKGSGSLASSGFDALSDLDSNGDGIISSLDDSFGLIKILKGDGSLISLEEAGIVSISLNNTSAGDDGNGIIDENRNTLVSLGSFVRGDGSIGSLGDFNLVVDKMDSVEVNEDRELKVA